MEDLLALEMPAVYDDRQDAGKRLADLLSRFKGQDCVVYSIVNGGVILGAEIAKKLESPMGLVLISKMVSPDNSECTIGAIAEKGKPIFDKHCATKMSDKDLKTLEKNALKDLEEKRRLYCNNEDCEPSIKGKTVIVVDDGMTTGLTMRSALAALRPQKPKWVVVAVPISSQFAVDTAESFSDEVVVMNNPIDFKGMVSDHYKKYENVDNNTIKKMLSKVK